MAQHIIDQSKGEKAIFRESCGFKDEALLHQLLREIADNKMKKSELNKTPKELKVV